MVGHLPSLRFTNVSHLYYQPIRFIVQKSRCLHLKEEKMPTMTIEIKVPGNIYQEDGVFVSVCPIFDIFSQGENEDEARENLTEAVRLFVETCIEMGTFRQVMEECGFNKSTTAVADDNAANNINIILPYIASKRLMECRA